MKEYFNIVVERLKEKGAKNDPVCAPFWERIIEIQKGLSEAEPIFIDQAWDFFIENAQWCIVSGIVSISDLVAWFPKEVLNYHGVYYNEDGLSLHNFRGILFSSVARITGHSFVSCFGRGTRIVARDSSCINIFDGEIEAKNCFVFAFNGVSAKIGGYGKLEAFDSVTASVSGYGYMIAGRGVKYTSGPLATVIQGPIMEPQI